MQLLSRLAQSRENPNYTVESLTLGETEAVKNFSLALTPEVSDRIFKRISSIRKDCKFNTVSFR